MFNKKQQSWKAIARNRTKRINQELFTKLLIAIDNVIFDNINDGYDDIIIISSPYSINKCIISIEQSLNTYKLNMYHIISIITAFLFGNKAEINSKINNSKQLIPISHLMDIMSIIIIDLSSSQYIGIPTNISDLTSKNKILNDKCNINYIYWRIKWKTTMKNNFINIMNNICNYIKKSKYNKYFTISSYDPKTSQVINTLDGTIMQIRNLIASFQTNALDLEKKIIDQLSKVKEYSANNDKKSALQHLKQKNVYQNQLKDIQTKIFKLEIQIMAVEDATVGPMHTSPPWYQTRNNILSKDDIKPASLQNDDMQVSINSLNTNKGDALKISKDDLDELENKQLAALEAMMK